jgi:hypothetical protein
VGSKLWLLGGAKFYGVHADAQILAIDTGMQGLLSP